MLREKNRDKWITCTFYVVVIAWFILILVGEIVLPAERASFTNTIPLYEGTWVQVSGGNRTQVEVPSHFDVEPGDMMILETTIPADVNEGKVFCFRASQQTIHIYVDGELRLEYDTSDSRPFGKNSTSSFVFCPLTTADAGKVLRIGCWSDSVYSGVMNEVYYGSSVDIYSMIVRQNLPEMAIAALMLLIGLTVLIICFVIRIGMGKKLPLEYLAICIIFAAIWIMSESKIQQFLVPNSSIIGISSFYVIMFIPFAAALYLDALQEERFHRFYTFMNCLLIADALVCTFLQVSDIMDLLETMYFTHAICILLMVGAFVCMFRDMQTGMMKRYGQVAIGFVFFALFTILELLLVYAKTYKLVGLSLSVGLLILLATAAVKTVQDIVQEERKRQKAVVAGEAKDEFLTRMSHEIRTPINSMLGMNEMILRENTDATINEYALNVERAGRMLLDLVNDILDLSKIQSGKMELVLHSYAVAPMIMDLANMFTERAENKGLEFVLQVEESLPTELVGDEIRIKQIVGNLLSNAVKYTKTGSVKLKVEGVLDEFGVYMLCFTVEDTGQGIKQENFDMLFHKFTRLEESNNQAIQGTGLGLSITQMLVNLMNGTIRVTSEYASGSTFVVEIPQEVFDITPIGEIGNYKSVKPIVEYRERLHADGAHILSVDDNEMNQAVLRTLLKKTGIKVDTAFSGMECLKKCEVERYDLIFMDHMMPEMDGIETFHKLREESGLNAKTKVIALTANAISGMKEMYLREGFSGYLTKPIDYASLQEILVDNLPGEMVSWKDEGWEAESKREETGKEDPVDAEGSQENGDGENDCPDYIQIDRKLGLSYCADDESFYQEMLMMFCQQGPENRSKLQEYLQAENWKEYATIAHAVKSTALSIGGKNFSELAKEHELRGKAGDGEFIRKEFDTFMSVYDAFLQEVGRQAKLK